MMEQIFVHNVPAFCFASVVPSNPEVVSRSHVTIRLWLLLDVLGCLFEAKVALLVRPTSSKPNTYERRPRPPLEQEDGEDDAETEAEGGLDQEVREAAIPLDGIGL